MKLFRSGIVRNALALYGVQVCRKVLPFVTIPYLARILGPTAWGRVAFVQAFSELLVLVIEFGFNLSATREVARARDSADDCSNILAGVLGAQALLSLLSLSVALVAYLSLPQLQADAWLIPGGVLYALAQGFAPLWFFQGIERMSVAAALEIAGKLLAVVGIFVFIHAASDAWKVLALQACAPIVSTVLGIFIAYRYVPARLPSVRSIRAAFAAGWPMFLFRSGISLYSIANAFTLGIFASPAQVAYYASSEKLAKAVYGLLNPIREALYPRLSHLATRSRHDMIRLAKAGAIAMNGGGFLLGAAVYLFAPRIVHILMGSAFGPAVPILRVLSLLPLIISVTDAVGIQWLLPHGHEKLATRIIFAGAMLNLVLALVLAPAFAAMGMAVGVVITESVVALAMALAVKRLALSPKASVPDNIAVGLVSPE